MGSLTSRPKIPVEAQQPVYVPIPQYISAPVAGAPAASTPEAAPPPPPPSASTGTPDIKAEETQREDGLLDRSRGLLSTVLTGFRGLLDDHIAPSSRKTLLGE